MIFSRVKFFFLKCLAILVMTLFSISSRAQDEKFTASTSSASVAVGEQFQITFTLTGNGKNFKAPVFSNFNVLVGPSQSSSVQINNGNFSQTLAFTYVLQAVAEGTFKIAGAEITGSKGLLISNPVTITVVKGSAQAQGGKQGSTQQNAADGSNVFMKASIDKSNVYMGEAIVVTYRLYTKVTLINYSIEKIPAMNGFWSQDIPMPQQLEFRAENINGVNYKVADLKKLVVFPQRSGNLQIDPMVGEVIARIPVKRQGRSNDPFDQFFNDPFFNSPFGGSVQDIKVPLKSEAIKVNVKELPGNEPANFSGAVGKFTYEVSIDKEELNAHEPVTLKLKFSGKGNIKLIEAPKITFPPDFEAYDPKENSNVNASMSGVTGTKTFEYLLIPRNPGEYKIQVADFTYFDLEKKMYQQIPSPELIIKVNKGDESGAVSGTSITNKSDIQFLGKDIRYIKTKDPVFLQQLNPFYGSGVFYTLLTAPILLFGGLILLRRRQEGLKGKVGLLRSRQANKVALKRLSSAKKLLQAKENEKFLDEISKAMWGFISDKLQIPVADLSKESAAEALLLKKVPTGLVEDFTNTIDKCEFARFAGSTTESHEMLYKSAFESISKIEESVRA